MGKLKKPEINSEKRYIFENVEERVLKRTK